MKVLSLSRLTVTIDLQHETAYYAGGLRCSFILRFHSHFAYFKNNFLSQTPPPRQSQFTLCL